MASAAPPRPLSTAKRTRESCVRCQRPLRVCYCAALPLQPLVLRSAHVLVLQHRHEKRHRSAISSVPVLSNVLDDASATIVTVDDTGAVPGASEQLDRLLFRMDADDDAAPFDNVLVLFPDATAKTLNAELLTSLLSPAAATRETQQAEDTASIAAALQPRTLLVVIDGTWTEAKKIVFHSRAHLELLATQRHACGLAFEFICLDDDDSSSTSNNESGTSSIYGDLRREPMAGCVSTLEAVALALRVLEPSSTRAVVPSALLRSFRAMVALQTQCMARGQQQALAKHGGVSKRDAIAARQQQQQQPAVHSDSSSNAPTSTPSQSPLAIERPYVFFTTHVDFRQRTTRVQHGPSVVCTYDDARTQCEQRNRDRKRGDRLTFIARDVFITQQQQQQQQQ